MNSISRMLLLIVLLVVVLVLLPAWPYSVGWGYYPSGGVGVVLAIFLLLIVMEKL